MAQLESSWSRCWPGLGASGTGLALMKRLVRAYSEPQRKYHTTQHLTECIATVEPHLALADHPAEVEIALWFHDAIYDLTAKDNEAKSAEWATFELTAADVDKEAIERVHDLIMATCHTALPQGKDQQLLVDVDLSILGAPRTRFIEYEEQVREEYRWVPGFLFRRKRRQILKEFLARHPIYNTPALRTRLEEPARANLAFSLERLGG
jgi:predicted metal-dependent HD superfamily phosphohydrolase